MPHSIRARFKPTPADYMRATLSFYFTQPSIILLTISSVLFVLLAVPISFVQWVQGSGIALFILAIAIMFFLIALITVVGPLIRIRMDASKDEQLRVETTWSITPDRIEVHNRYERSELVWEMFSRLIETRKYLLLVHAENKRQFTFLPKRAFMNRKDYQEFVELARNALR
jgi:hypothetical protein